MYIVCSTDNCHSQLRTTRRERYVTSNSINYAYVTETRDITRSVSSSRPRVSGFSLLSTRPNTKYQMAVRYHEMLYENFMSSFAEVASMSDNKLQGIFESVLGTISMSKFENLAKCTKEKQMHEILASIFNFIQIILQSSLLYIL